MKQLREKANLRRIDIAYHLDVAESTVRNWEYGRTVPTLGVDQVALLCRLYSCSIDELEQAVKESRSEAVA